MPLKNTFNINNQMVNFGSMPQLIPCSYTEVAPGESIQGSVEVNVHSAPTIRNIQTAAYLDGFSFYVPFRLLWEGFPDWLVKGDGNFPYVTDLMPKNYEGHFTIPSGGTGTPGDQNTVWRRRCYNLVYNSFFAKDENEVTDLDDNTVRNCYQRPSTFEVASQAVNLSDSTVDTSGASVTVDAIRQAFSNDAFSKMRQFYGERYVDYLASRS